jgi:hypothetical protein
MKRIALLILAALPAWAAGSCTVSAPVQFAASASWMVSVACTGDASTGSFPAVNLKALQPLLGGYISRVETVPGTTAPTANYTMTLLDAKGGDELNGQGSGTMSSTATQIFAVGTGTPITAQETLNLSGNSVASAGVAIYLYVIAANNTMAQILALGGTVSGGGGGGGGVTSVFSRTGAVTAHTGDYSVGQVTGAAGINGSPTANAVVTYYGASLVQTPNDSSTLDGSGNLGVGGSITSGVGCVTTACISSDTWYDSGATHATVQLGATTGYNGTNTWDGNAPTNNYVWTAYGVSGNNASVGWVAPAAGGTVTSVACNSSFGASWLTCSFGATASVTPILQLSPTTAQTSHQVIGTCGSATTFGPCSLVAGDIPALSYLALTGGTLTGNLTDAGEIVTGTAATDTAALGSELTTSGTCSGTGWTGTYPNYVAPATTAALTCTGFTNNAYYQTVTGITNNAGVTGMTYGSGLSCTGTGTYPLTVTGGGGSGATGTITVTSGAVTAAIAVLTAGTAFTSTPTTGTLGTPTGSASCSGTLAMTSTIGGGTITVAIGSAGAAQQSGTSTNAASSTFIWGPKANGTSLTYTPTAAFVGTINISAKAITPISTFALTLKDSTGAASSVCTQTLASLFNLFCGGGGTYTTTGNSNTASGYLALYFNTTGASNTASGLNTLFSNTTGSYNTASGYGALYSNTTGSYNTASGLNTLYNCGTSGAACTSNVALGYNAGRNAGTGTTTLTSISTSILIGQGAAAANATGDSNEILICGTGSVAANGTNTATLGCPATTDVYAGSAGAALTHTAGIANGGTVYSVAGTPLPACNSTNLLKRLPASDITTLGAAYVGSGTFTAWVECTYNSTGAVYAWYAM